ncbi:hypothetical protein [Anaeromicrobium sediminis]|uniref:hypothetical protein n=1 Tax=Anaeromicrobium sediminis TaxID=1478221 RepID=UPI001595C00E|nr:hypothetical protein [Anaeromicrobium sediminis]
MSRMKWLAGFLPLIIYIAIISTFELTSRTKEIIIFVILGVNLLVHLYRKKKRKTNGF